MRWTQRFFRRGQTERRLDAELQFHLEAQTADLIASGLPPEEAARQARLRFGGLDSAKEQCRETGAGHFLEVLWQDLRYGGRQLRRHPGTSIVIVLVIGLAIGANSAVFSLLDGLLLRSLPVHDPQHLYLVSWRARHVPNGDSYSYGDCSENWGRENPHACSFSYSFYQALQANRRAFAQLAAFADAGSSSFQDANGVSIVSPRLVSGNFFATLGVRPALGRLLQPSDDRLSAPPAVVLSYRFWQRAFGGSPSALGARVRLNRVPVTIVGVAARTFTSLTPGFSYDMYAPLSLQPRLTPQRSGWRADAHNVWLVLVGRLASGVSAAQAQAAASLAFRRAMLDGSNPALKPDDAPEIALAPAQTALTGTRERYSHPLFLMLTAVGLLLLLACANIAGLLLARTATRDHELAIRTCLGAGRGRLRRQLMTEALLLAACGGMLGLAAAALASRWLAALFQFPPWLPGVSDWRVLLFTAAAAAITALLAGLLPAFRASRSGPLPALQKGGMPASTRGPRGGQGLVVLQVALGVILLAGAGLLARTLHNFRSVNPGFDTSHLLVFHVDPSQLGYTPAAAHRLVERLRQDLLARPGIVSAGYAGQPLLRGGRDNIRFYLSDGKSMNSSDISIGSGFFQTMGIALLAGRDFTAKDLVPRKPGTPAALPAPAIVNRAFVEAYVPNRDPIGWRFGKNRQGHFRYVIVGVSADTDFDTLRAGIGPVLYRPDTESGAVTFSVRTVGNPRAIIPIVRGMVRRLDASLPVSGVMTENDIVSRLFRQERLLAEIASFFAAAAALLVCLGLYGLLAQDVTRRTREIGIRMALGANPADIRRRVIGRGLALTAIGCTAGWAAAWALTRQLKSLLFGVQPGDPLTLAAVVALLLLVAAAASYIPARRATRIDPVAALNCE